MARSIDAPAAELDQVKEPKALGLSFNYESDRVTRATLKLSFR